MAKSFVIADGRQPINSSFSNIILVCFRKEHFVSLKSDSSVENSHLKLCITNKVIAIFDCSHKEIK